MTEMEVNDEECWQSVKDGAFPRGVLFVCPWYVPYMCEEEPCIYWVLVRAEPMLNNTAPRTPLLLLPLTNDPQHTFVHKQKRVNTFTLNCSVQGNIQQSPTPMPCITCVYTHTHTHTHKQCLQSDVFLFFSFPNSLSATWKNRQPLRQNLS